MSPRPLLLLALALVALLPLALADSAPPAASLKTPGPTLRHSAGLRAIEWRVTPATQALSMHIYTSGTKSAPRSQLFTFDDGADVRGLVRSRLARDLAADHMEPAEARCSVHAGKALVDESRGLVELLQSEEKLSLVCTSRSGARAVWQFVQFEKPRLAPNEVRAANALHRAATNEQRDYPFDGLELLAENWSGVWGWVESFLRSHWGPLHPFNDYEGNTEQTGRWHLNTGAVLEPGTAFGSESDAPVRIAIAADWGAGTREADFLQQVMMKGNGTEWKPHHTLHVGDIYYVGDEPEIKSNCLGIAPEGVKQGVKWPHGSIGSFAVQGNHEMYSRAYGFFDVFLPTLGVTDPVTGESQGQDAGYVALENKYWRVIMLDTGYGTYSLNPKMDSFNNAQPESVIRWLRDVVQIGNKSDTRGLIFLTHHQVVSAFGAPYPATPKQIAALIPNNRTVVWLWGHEHRMAWYAPADIDGLRVHGRTIGNSGFPASVAAIPAKAKEVGLMVYDDRVYQQVSGFFDTKTSYNGFTHLTLEGPVATLEYATLATDPNTGVVSDTIQTDLLKETFKVDQQGNVQLTQFSPINPELTFVN